MGLSVVIFVLLVIIIGVIVCVTKKENADNSDSGKKRKIDFFQLPDWIIGQWNVGVSDSGEYSDINQISFVKTDTYKTVPNSFKDTIKSMGEAYSRDSMNQRMLINGTTQYAMNYVEFNKIVKLNFKILPRENFASSFCVDGSGVAHTFGIYKDSKKNEIEICFSQWTTESVKMQKDIRIRRIETGFAEKIYLSIKSVDDTDYKTEFLLTKKS